MKKRPSLAITSISNVNMNMEWHSNPHPHSMTTVTLLPPLRSTIKSLIKKLMKLLIETKIDLLFIYLCGTLEWAIGLRLVKIFCKKSDKMFRLKFVKDSFIFCFTNFRFNFWVDLTHNQSIERSKEASAHKNVSIGPWLWLSWQSGRFLYHKTEVRIQTSTIFYLPSTFWKDESKEKETGNGPFLK